MKWTEADRLAAAKQGWLLCDVFDLKRRDFRMMVLPVNPKITVEQVTRAVTAYAKNGDEMAQRALRAVVTSPPVPERTNEAPARKRR